MVFQQQPFLFFLFSKKYHAGSISLISNFTIFALAFLLVIPLFYPETPSEYYQ